MKRRLKPGKQSRDKNSVSRQDAKTQDIHQGPDYPVSGITDGNGTVFTSVEVAVIFWGKYWSSSPAPTPSADTYYQAYTGVVTGPYMTGLRQYRGVGPGTMLGKFINDSSDPPNGYGDSDITNMIVKFLNDNPSVPQPESGHQRFYAVVTPPGLNDPEAYGKHITFNFNGITAPCCWINNEDGILASNSTGVVNTFSHELAEACTDPFGSGIHVTGPGGSGDEIGDTCNNEFAIVQMNGVKCNVQCYWSQADNACIIPLGQLTFLINKNSFGKDEVQEAIAKNKGVFRNAFWLALEDYSIDTFNAFNVVIPTPSGPFSGVSGVRIVPTPAKPGDPPPAQPIPVYEDPTNTSLIQRIRFSFDVVFDNPITTPFPASGVQEYALTATFTINGDTATGPNSQETVNFDLAAGADPFFSNIDPTDNSAVAWLSEDLRVFTVIKGQSAIPGDPSAPVFQNSQTAYDYIQTLIGYLNSSTRYTVPVPPTSPDPLNGLTFQTGYETGDSSVTPLDGSGHQNYNFAVARVRLTSDLQGSAGEANNVRVFFRLWVAPSCDTDFDPYTTYLSTPSYPSNPTAPLPSSASLPPDPNGNPIQTVPFFATDKNGSHDYDSSVANANIRPIEIPQAPGQDSVWAYYGCFLDVYDSQNNTSFPGTHHCLVAQIAYDNAPLEYNSGTPTNPGNTDKLAQRNLQITSSGNPGPVTTHRIPQAFDTRPSLPYLDQNGRVQNEPDELMIDWANTPVGSKAQIYWPEVTAANVVALADRLYGTHLLTVIDANTIGFKTVKGVTYIPIPAATNKKFAGLFTVDLPLGVKKGQEFNILVRRIATQKAVTQVITKRATGKARKTAPTASAPHPVNASDPTVSSWRYITGAFQVKIPVTTEDQMLGPEENTLAILKARLAAMSPHYRWYPVVQRMIDVVAGRVDGSGGNSVAVPPSLLGYQPKEAAGGGRHHHPPQRERLCEHTGKISGLLFDRFGDFEGFVLDTEDGPQSYFSRERDMRELAERVWRERLRIRVWSEHDEEHRALRILISDPPAVFRC